MTIYGYARVSTSGKQNIERQARELKELGCTDETIFMDWESGSVENRSNLQKLLDTIREGDCLCAVSIDRISRSTKQLISIIELVEAKKLKLIVGSFIVDCTSNKMDIMTEALLKVVSVFSEMERKMICSRVQSGVDNARAKGVKLGRPKTTYDTIPSIFFKILPLYQRKDLNLTQFSNATKLSIPSIYKYLEIVEQNN